MTEGRELSPSETHLVSCEIWIDREGDWYHRGARMERADIVAHLCQHLGRDESSGRYVIRMAQEECYVEVEDTPFVITRVISKGGEQGGDAKGFFLAIKHLDQTERLDPASLRVGRDNVLYCTVKPERLPARFLRPAYYQLAEFIYEDPERGGFYLPVAGRRYYIREGVTP
ncbi:MAG TPA: hypothetical protein VEI04_13675 [Syntrophobacteria bacterium]|nr:hypothetical protein [Syntrophobacteria bacterium]